MCAGTHVGENYLAVLSHASESVPSEFGVWERTVGDVLDPFLPGSAMEIVNKTTLALGMDTSGWSWHRLVSMASSLEREYAGVEG